MLLEKSFNVIFFCFSKVQGELLGSSASCVSPDSRERFPSSPRREL